MAPYRPSRGFSITLPQSRTRAVVSPTSGLPAWQPLEPAAPAVVVDPQDAPVALAQLEGPPAVIEVVAGPRLGSPGPGNEQVVPLRDAKMGRVDRRRCGAERLGSEPVPV